MSSPIPSPATLSGDERALLLALTTAALPPGRFLPGGDAATAGHVERFIASLPPHISRGYRGLLRGLDVAARARYLRGFARLTHEQQLRLLHRLRDAEPTALALRGLLTPLKLAYFEEPARFSHLGARFEIAATSPERPPRWHQRITDATALDEDLDLECDVVVVGTGAGGAPIARELAARGHAVLLLEEGPHVTRQDFNGRGVAMMRRLYRDGGATFSLGNHAIAIPTGRAVGGTTIINSGTCYRAPESTLAEWRDAHGLVELGPGRLDPYYERVEATLEVAPTEPRYLGALATAIARGADALGWAHKPLLRNAPGCDAQAVCCFGCPTDAKRSTNLSYIPDALSRGAELLTGVRVDRVHIEGGRATGVSGSAPTPNGPRHVRVRARVTVLSCGALHTPALLLANGLANRSGQLGANLSIHPATAGVGVFPEVIDAFTSVPQGYAVEEFRHEGLLYEGATPPLDITAAMFTSFGVEYMQLIERARHFLPFGFMVKDSSWGRVTAGPDGRPRIRYVVNETDRGKLQRGLGLLSRLLFAAGAEEVQLPVVGRERLTHPDQVFEFERTPIAARRIDLSAYHPLGTARLGRDPARSVVSPTHETHDHHNLYIVDGASVPGVLSVNPQMTLMALSLRAAEFVDQRLSG